MIPNYYFYFNNANVNQFSDISLIERRFIHTLHEYYYGYVEITLTIDTKPIVYYDKTHKFVLRIRSWCINYMPFRTRYLHFLFWYKKNGAYRISPLTRRFFYVLLILLSSIRGLGHKAPIPIISNRWINEYYFIWIICFTPLSVEVSTL